MMDSFANQVDEATRTTQPLDDDSRLAAHVVLLTNFVPPHCLPVYRELAGLVRKLTVLVSTPMESHRDWKVDWTGLDVRVQRTWTVRLPWRHPHGFLDSLQVHIPHDTLSQLKRLSPDVVISLELGARSFFAALYGQKHRQVGIVWNCNVSEHTEQGRGRLRYWLRRWLLRQAHAVTVNGSSGQAYLEHLGASPGSLYRVPYTPVPAAIFQGDIQRPPSLARRLLYVGQLIERKGLMPFAAALADWAARNPQVSVDWDVVGTGPLQGKLKGFAFPENVRLQLLGALPFEEIAAQYGRAGVFVFPTLADEWGLVVNEAMLAGLPILGSIYSQAVTDLCTEGETGWMFRPDHPEETVRALELCFATPDEKLLAMRHAARQRVQDITPAVAARSLVGVARAAIHRAAENTRSHPARRLT